MTKLLTLRAAILELLLDNYQQELAKSSPSQHSLDLHKRMNDTQAEIERIKITLEMLNDR